MEYVANAQGQDVAVTTGTAIAAAVQPAPVGANAAATTSTIIANAAPASVSTLAQLESFYKKELARVEADAAVIKRFAATVMAASKAEVADVSAVETLPRAVKLVGAILLVAAYAAGFATKLFL